MTIREALTLLELQTPVTHEQVRKAFRRLAKQWHPDLQPSPLAQQRASEVFIQLRKANDYLLERSEESINHPGPERRTVQRVRRTSPVQKAPPPVINHPLFQEVENVARLFRLISRKEKKNAFSRRWSAFQFSPGSWLGRMYEVLIERRFPSEDRLNGMAYALFRLFHILWGSIFLIVLFIGLSLAGLLSVAILFPPVMGFLGVYTLYHFSLEKSVRKLNKTIVPGNRLSWINARSKYLFIRSLPLLPMLALAALCLFLSLSGTYYVRSLATCFSLMIIALVLSVVYEWLHFFRIKRMAG